MSLEHFTEWLLAEFNLTNDLTERYEILAKIREYDSNLADQLEIIVNV